jgi:hypothetical protein
MIQEDDGPMMAKGEGMMMAALRPSPFAIRPSPFAQ